MFGGVAGFGERIFDEGAVRLGAFGRVELRLRQDFDVQIGEEAGNSLSLPALPLARTILSNMGFP